jgi:Mg-chelatase subunit ChlD
MNNQLTELVFILDRSGSMHGLGRVQFYDGKAEKGRRKCIGHHRPL